MNKIDLFLDLFLYFTFAIPIIGILLYTFFNPAESFLFGKRWMFEEEPEVSQEAISYIKFSSIISIIIMIIMSIFAFLDKYR